MPLDKLISLELKPRPLKVAHRGYHKIHIENTLEAFRSAYESGCDMVEFDVQLSKDGIPFIFHDEDCLRLCKQPIPFYELSAAEIRQLKMKPMDGRVTSQEYYQIPSLSEFLQEFGRQAFYLELKVPLAKVNDSKYFQSLGSLVARAVLDYDLHPNSFLGSFHLELLKFLEKSKAFPTLAGIFEDYGKFQEVQTGMDLEAAKAIRYYSISWALYQKFIQEYASIPATLLTQNILIWDISGASDFIRSWKDGVAGLVTDDIATLVNMELK